MAMVPGHGAALISDSTALSHTPAEAAGPWMHQQWAPKQTLVLWCISMTAIGGIPKLCIKLRRYVCTAFQQPCSHLHACKSVSAHSQWWLVSETSAWKRKGPASSKRVWFLGTTQMSTLEKRVEFVAYRRGFPGKTRASASSLFSLNV